MNRIPISGPSITSKEIEWVSRAAASAWYEGANSFQDKFEKEFANYLGTRFAVSLPSCTSAIHLALLALGVGPGDEVIVPEITWIASAAPIQYVGARPVFADIDENTWCLSPESFAANITAKTKAVIPVDLYGGIGRMDRIREIASQHGIAVIEDAAQAIGSRFRGRLAGTLGDVGVFSFHGTKTLTTGEGGMLVTDREDLYQRVLFLRDHGRQADDRSFFSTEVTYKYKMSDLQAALGIAQLERIEDLIAMKRRNFEWYREALAGIPGIRLNPTDPEIFSSYWMATILVSPDYQMAKEPLIHSMKEKGIECRPFFYPLSSLPAYESGETARAARQRNTVSYGISPYGLNLPSAMNLTQEQVSYVVANLRGLLGNGRNAGSERVEAR